MPRWLEKYLLCNRRMLAQGIFFLNMSDMLLVQGHTSVSHVRQTIARSKVFTEKSAVAFVAIRWSKYSVPIHKITQICWH